MVLDALARPIVLAPMAGGPSTPELAAAVCEAGGLGFLAAGYLAPETLAEQVAALRALTHRPFGVNVFVPGPAPAQRETYEPYVRRLAAWAAEHDLPVGEPRHDDDGYAEKIDLLLADPPAAISFTFGCPSDEVSAAVRGAGSEVWATVTCPAEAEQAAPVADVLIAQGIEAGGHRGTFTDRDDAEAHGTLALVELVRPRFAGGLVATGGLTSREAVAGAIAAGADAVQAGSAFLLCPEAGTSAAQREAMRAGGPTAMTRAFSGRLARGIRNAFMDEHGAHAPLAYPEIHHLTAPLRREARARGDAASINLWAGEAYALARAEPAADVVARLAP
ncbi:MAG: NAD(P)H-dependent flavin oxidoreductase [Solirubrobacteraceae bacterium]